MKTNPIATKWRISSVVKLLPVALAMLFAAFQNADAVTYRLIHAFAGGATDGNSPVFESSLLPVGTSFYGMTALGGATSNGVLFQINMSGGPVHLVHDFKGYSILDLSGSKNDGAYPIGTPVLSGSTLYGMTQQGGSNRLGTVFEVNTDGNGFQVMHHFGDIADGYAPYGSLILSGGTLYGMTQAGGDTNVINEGTIFSIGTDGSNYQILHTFTQPDDGGPQGSLLLFGGLLYGMTRSTIFQIDPSGSNYQVLHTFAGSPNDGGNAVGSLIASGSMLYGMTFQGGTNNLGTIFAFNPVTTNLQVLHSFALTEAYEPHGDLALFGSTLYGMSYGGVTNYHTLNIGSGDVFQIDTGGDNYKVLHTFIFPFVSSDGSLPFGTPVIVGPDLFGMTSIGGSITHDKGCIFALGLGSGGIPGAPRVTITAPINNSTVNTPTLVVAGTVRDAGSITNVILTLNGTNTLAVNTTDGYVKWTATASNYPPGTNIIAATAENATGSSSTTKMADFFYKVPTLLTGAINGHGTLAPNDLGKDLNINEGYTMKATASPGFKFTNWVLTVTTNVTTNSNPKLAFQMAPGLHVTANFVDDMKPIVKITTKSSTGSNGAVAITGTASDNVGVVAVWYQADSNGWNLAATSDAFVNWSAVLLLGAGPNIVHVYAEDAAGNRSETNSISLDDTGTGFALESVVGTTLDLLTTNEDLGLSFGDSSFSLLDGSRTNAAVGLYTYTLTGPNSAELAVTITAPPMPGGDTNLFNLSFNAEASGTFTDSNTNSGTFTITDASWTAPASIAGLTLQGTNSTNSFSFTNQYGDGTFAAADTSGNSSGTYTFSQYSPNAALLTASLTNSTNAGTTNYTVLTFLADSNLFDQLSIDATNGMASSYGTFTVAGLTTNLGYTAPVSVAGLTGALTFKSTNGHNVSFMISYGDSTFGQFTTAPNVSCSVGTYTYTRTGLKTARYLDTPLAPPEEAGNDIASSDYFTRNKSANITNAQGHGTITFSVAADTAPLSLAGRKISSSGRHGPGAFAFGDDTFVGSEGENGKVGTYTYGIYGPQAAMVIFNFTDFADAGKSSYVTLWFATATSGSYSDDDGAGNISVGTFTLK